ncbi:MAG: ATP-dependent zinc metalloprotease FtsH [Alloprevotella sp.]|nr:ATP-dependent zinc metalloprotease FtsH [Alloprevotella sp.]
MANAPKKKGKVPHFSATLLYVLILIGILTAINLPSFQNASVNKDVTYTELQNYIKKGYGKNIAINKTDGTAKLYIKGEHIRDVFQQTSNEVGKEPSVSAQVPSPELIYQFLNEQGFAGKIEYKTSSGLVTSIIMNVGWILLFFGFWYFIFGRIGRSSKGGGIFSVGKSQARLFEKENGTNVSFKDVAGQEGAKQEVQEIVDFLKNPGHYTELGGKIPKGALLVGPPGTGKTLLAKAVAGEANVPFFSLSGSDFVEMFVGVGASRVRDLFRQAKEKAPCIIFIDEIDAIGRARGRNMNVGSNDERESTLNQLLTEMDGFDTNSGVILLAATNRADILDKALLRAGRFDRQIHVDLPDLAERVAIFKVHLRPVKYDQSIDVELLARQTPGFSGADIANVCNEAALIAARHKHTTVVKQDFIDAVDRIIGGLEKKTKVMTEEEKRVIALHEAGHASVSWLLEYANPLVKVTIVPRGQALGAAWYLPEERTITTREQMLDELCALLGGRAAEEVFTGHISSGALNDLERATKSTYGMVAYLGMSDKLSNLCYYNNEEYGFTKPYSEKTSETIDAEVQRIISEQYERAKQILTEHAEQHAELARVLTEREVIFTEDVEKIFGPRPWKSRADQLLEEQEDAKRKKAEAMAEAHARAKAAKAEAEASAAGMPADESQLPPPPPTPNGTSPQPTNEPTHE